jgi:hypothetical protein
VNRFAFILFLLSASGLLAAEPDGAMPPLPPSPVVEFRAWLKLPPEGRATALALRSPESRKVLEEKLREYEALPAVERERRLCAVELHWYLQQLITMNKADREDALTQVPKKFRLVVGKRLQQWEALEKNVGTEQKKQILENEVALKYVSSPQLSAPPMPVEMEVQNRLRDFFKMSQPEQEKALEHFARGERNEMIATLKAFRALPEDERARCINSFGQFTRMSAEEQAEFLRNVDRWQSMPKEQRETWRELVQNLPPMPPLPDEMIMPPMPR